ncbi:MAG: sugar transferase [Oscillospiraceae bacterium]|nr:sugar transferase [Oscillospiraceae bacterium]
MKEQTKKNLKTAATVTGLALGATYLVMRHIAKKQYPDSVYANQPEEQNPVQGRKVVFVENADDPVNADGKQGHLEAVGNSTHIPTFYEKYIKRGFDVILSFGGLVVLAPVYAVTALAIKADDPGPVFFKQKRVGTDKSYFELLKFRSMSVNTPKDVPTHMLQNGGITKVGAFIRKASIDELPQLWNIFRGNMSVIGPRPALWNQDYLTAERDKYGANDVKPGLTGLAQINGRDELLIEEKAKYDGVYAAAIKKSSWSGFLMDLKMFLGSVFSVLKKEGIVEGGTGALAKEYNKANQFDESEYNFDVANKVHTYSVLMSVYKNDDPVFLTTALRSIYEDQTVKPDEIVVVFDGPLTDELYAVLNEFQVGKEDVVKYYPQEENHGLGEALRIGSEKCTCDYILRMDSDDISDPKRFERQIAYVETHPDVDVLGTDIAEFDTSLDESMRVRSCPEHHDDIVKMGKKRNPMNHVTVCMKRTALEKCGGYKTLLLLEDYYLWLHMIAANCKLANIHESLVYVRVGNGFDSKRGSKERITGWKTLQDFMLDHGMINKKEAMMNMLYIRAFVNTPSGVKKVLYEKLLRK